MLKQLPLTAQFPIPLVSCTPVFSLRALMEGARGIEGEVRWESNDGDEGDDDDTDGTNGTKAHTRRK